MARGGFRPGAGRPRKSAPPVPPVAVTVEVKREAKKPGKDNLTPLEYALAVMNDDDADVSRRDRLAIAAMPFVHARAEDAKPGKKEERQSAAKEVSKGRFAPPTSPQLVVDNGR